MDPACWNLLRGGGVTELARDGERVRLAIVAGYLQAAPVVLQLTGVTTCAYQPYDGALETPEVVDAAAIVAAAPDVDEAVVEPDGELVVWGQRGSLRLRYDTLAIEGGSPAALREIVEAYWEAWRARWDGGTAHALVRACVGGPGWSHAQLPPLLAAWRRERTSELAETIDILSRRTRDPVGVAIEALAQDARASWGILPGAAYAERERERGRVWAAITGALVPLLDAPPDPRIGRAIDQMLRGPLDHVRADGAWAFADHALALLERNADAGTPDRLDHRAADLSIEADCNGAAMAAGLRALATTLRERLRAAHQTDRYLPDVVVTALRNRAISRG